MFFVLFTNFTQTREHFYCCFESLEELLTSLSDTCLQRTLCRCSEGHFPPTCTALLHTGSTVPQLPKRCLYADVGDPQWTVRSSRLAHLIPSKPRDDQSAILRGLPCLVNQAAQIGVS
jgi:hypothetical protein